MSKPLDAKLLKIVALAKRGIGGEKENADRLVRSMCERLGLDYAEVMQEGEQYKEFVLPVKYTSEGELRILAQVCWRFADTGDPQVHIGYNAYRKVIFVTTTLAKFVETSQAAVVYLRAYRKERRRLLEAVPGAFIAKNRLYSEHPDEDSAAPTPELTPEQRAKRWREAQLVDTMDSVKIHKAIEAPKA